MSTGWLIDPVFWVLALPALVVSGVLVQMVLSLFTCCGSFKFQGRPVLLKWWMIPATCFGAALLWVAVIAYSISMAS